MRENTVHDPMRAIASLLTAFVLLAFAPPAAAACNEVAAGVRTCDDNWDGETDGVSVVQEPAEGVRATVGAGYVDFGSVGILIAGANSDVVTDAGTLRTRTYTWCYDLNDDITDCENQIGVVLVDADTEVADADAQLVYWDAGYGKLSQNFVDVRAEGLRVYALAYGYCQPDDSLDGCRSILSSNTAGAQTPLAAGNAVVFFVENGGQAHACVIAVVGACQQVPTPP